MVMEWTFVGAALFVGLLLVVAICVHVRRELDKREGVLTDQDVVDRLRRWYTSAPMDAERITQLMGVFGRRWYEVEEYLRESYEEPRAAPPSRYRVVQHAERSFVLERKRLLGWHEVDVPPFDTLEGALEVLRQCERDDFVRGRVAWPK